MYNYSIAAVNQVGEGETATCFGSPEAKARPDKKIPRAETVLFYFKVMIIEPHDDEEQSAYHGCKRAS